MFKVVSVFVSAPCTMGAYTLSLGALRAPPSQIGGMNSIDLGYTCETGILSSNPPLVPRNSLCKRSGVWD